MDNLSKPVAYIADCGTIVSDSDPFFDDYKNLQPLYTAPPAPAVPEVLANLLSIVRSPRALPRRKEWVSGQQYSYVLLENVEAMTEGACRAAMLAAAPKIGK